MASISCQHIYKIYPGATAPSVTDFNLEIQDKEFIIFVGPSGCGKSTTLRMIAGLEEISKGEMYIGGRLINDVPPKDRDIAMVFQSYALYPHMTVYKNIAFGLELRKTPKDEIDRMVKEAEAHEAEDKKRKEDAETRNQAESFAYQTEKLVNDNKDKLSDDVAKEVTDKVNELKEALKGEDIEKIKSAQSELMTSAQKIGQALYAQQGAADAAGAAGAAGAGAAGSASNGSDDDVVDAEVVDDDDKDNK